MKLKDSYYTITEASKELGISRQTISRWITTGKIVAETVGREKLIKKDFLKDLLADKRIDAIFNKIRTELMTKIREKYNYSEEDKITSIPTPDKYITLQVNKKSGDIDTLRADFKLKDFNNGMEMIFKIEKMPKKS